MLLVAPLPFQEQTTPLIQSIRRTGRTDQYRHLEALTHHRLQLRDNTIFLPTFPITRTMATVMDPGVHLHHLIRLCMGALVVTLHQRMDTDRHYP